MFIFDSPLVTCSIILFAYLTWIYRDHAIGTHKRIDLYTPPGHPFIGNLVFVIKNELRLEWLITLREQRTALGDHRPISFTIPFIRLIESSDPASIEYLQKTNFENFAKGKITASSMGQILGAGIFVVDGDAWRVARKATSKIFTGNLFRTIITSSIEEDLIKLKSILNLHAESGQPLDLAELLFAFTLSSFARFAFSVDVGSLTDTEAIQVPFASAFDAAQRGMARRFNNSLWPITERFSGEKTEMIRAKDTLDTFVNSILEDREQTVGIFDRDSKASAGKTDLLSLFMALRDENTGLPMDKKTLRDSVLNLLIAGRDTTAQALCWTMFHLINQPTLMDDIRKEVDCIGTIVDYDSHRKFVRTVAALHEGLRLHPSIPQSIAECISDDVLPNGTKLFRKEIVLYSGWRMGRDKAIWGEDAGLFRPSRWLDERDQIMKESQYKFNAFNGGARHCLGQNLAVFQSVSILTTILKDFNVSFAPNYLKMTKMVQMSGDVHKTPQYSDSLSLPMLEPLMITVSSIDRK